MKAVAEKLLSYYGKMESRYGGYWKADIDAAATWLALLNSVEEPSDAAIAGLLAKLNAATAHRGTAWEEMSLNIRAWVKSMQQKRALASVGTGFLFPTRAGEIALDACLRVLRLKWPRAAFQACNALQAPCGYEALSIGRATALFVYKDADSALAAEQGEAGNHPGGAVVYLSRLPEGISAVIAGSPPGQVEEMAESLRSALRMDILNVAAHRRLAA